MPSRVRTVIYAPDGARRGFTLTEMAVVLGIIGIVMAAIWVAAAQVGNARKTQLATQQVVQIAQNYKMLYGKSGIDPSQIHTIDVTAIGINAGYFPAEMGGSVAVDGTVATYPVTPWGTLASVYTIGGFSGVPMVLFTPQTIVIAYHYASASACVSLASSLFFLPGINWEYINGGVPNNLLINAPWPISSANGTSIAGLCAANPGGADDYVEVGFPAR